MSKLALGFIAFILLLIIFKWIHYLAKNNYINWHTTTEGFSIYNFLKSSNTRPFFPTFPNIIEKMIDRGTAETSHTVNLPLNTNVSCRNACINNRCSFTGQQCLADIDCPGCNNTILSYNKLSNLNVSPYNDSGKSAFSSMVGFSSLTSDIGSRAFVFNKENQSLPSPQANLGKNNWKYSLDEGQKMFSKRYSSKSDTESKKINKYYDINTNTVTGLFVNDGPLPSNY